MEHSVREVQEIEQALKRHLKQQPASVFIVHNAADCDRVHTACAPGSLVKIEGVLYRNQTQVSIGLFVAVNLIRRQRPRRIRLTLFEGGALKKLWFDWIRLTVVNPMIH